MRGVYWQGFHPAMESALGALTGVGLPRQEREGRVIFALETWGGSGGLFCRHVWIQRQQDVKRHASLR